MGILIVVDCEAPFGVGAPSVGDMTEFGAVDVNALRDRRVETFHGTDCSEDGGFYTAADDTKPSTHTDSVLASGVTTIKAAHIGGLRLGVK